MSLFRSKSWEPEEEPKVEWITSVTGLVEQYPPVPARRVLPEWFKTSETRIEKPKPPQHNHGGPGGPPPPLPELPGGPVVGPPTYYVNDFPTIRSCPGVVDVLRAGWVVKAWTDIEIITPHEPGKGDGPDRFQAKTSMSGPSEPGGNIGSFGPHLNQRFPMHPGEYDFALKFDSPWLCKTPPGYSMLYLPVPYAEQTPWRVIMGITDNDDFHAVNIVATWSHYGTYLIEAGTPLAWLLPVKRDGFAMKSEVRHDPEYAALLGTRGKGGIGSASSNRLINGSYILERARRRKERGER